MSDLSNAKVQKIITKLPFSNSSLTLELHTYVSGEFSSNNSKTTKYKMISLSENGTRQLTLRKDIRPYLCFKVTGYYGSNINSSLFMSINHVILFNSILKRMLRDIENNDLFYIDNNGNKRINTSLANKLKIQEYINGKLVSFIHDLYCPNSCEIADYTSIEGLTIFIGSSMETRIFLNKMEILELIGLTDHSFILTTCNLDIISYQLL